MDRLECATRSIAKGQWSEAAALLEHICAHAQRGSDAWAVATSMHGECLTRLGRFEEAQPLLEASHEVLEREQGSPSWRESVRRLVDHWQLRGSLERAADLHILLVMDDRRRAASNGTSPFDGWSEVPQQ